MKIEREPAVTALLRSRPELEPLMEQAERLAARYITPSLGARWIEPPVSSEQIELVVSTAQPELRASAQLGALARDPRWEGIVRESRGAILCSVATAAP